MTSIRLIDSLRQRKPAWRRVHGFAAQTTGLSKLFLQSTTAFGARRANVLGCLLQLAVVLGVGPATFAVVGAADASPIELFVPEGCPPCGRAKTVMGQLGRERPELPIVVRDVQQDPAAMARLQ